MNHSNYDNLINILPQNNKLEKKKKLLKASIIILIIGIISSVFLYIVVNNQKLNYEEVKVTVLNVDTKIIKKGKRRQFKNTVKVLYNSKSYELKNVTNVNKYRYRESNAYLYNNDLYANIQGIKTSTPIANIYFGSLFVLFPIMIFFTYCLIDYKKEKKFVIK